MLWATKTFCRDEAGENRANAVATECVSSHALAQIRADPTSLVYWWVVLDAEADHIHQLKAFHSSHDDAEVAWTRISHY